jgi:hypothetical protein
VSDAGFNPKNLYTLRRTRRKPSIIYSIPVPGPTQPLRQWLLTDLYMWVRRCGLEADSSPSSDAKVRNECRRSSTPLHGAHTDTFIFSIPNSMQRFGKHRSVRGGFCLAGADGSVISITDAIDCRLRLRLAISIRHDCKRPLQSVTKSCLIR